MEEFIRRERTYPRVAESFYRAVTQAVLLFGSETWVLSEAMVRTVEGTQTRFQRQIMGKQIGQKADGTWVTPRTEVTWEVKGTQSETTYIRRRQGTVAQWVTLWLIFDACAREMGYEKGGHRRDAWWSH